MGCNKKDFVIFKNFSTLFTFNNAVKSVNFDKSNGCSTFFYKSLIYYKTICDWLAR